MRKPGAARGWSGVVDLTWPIWESMWVYPGDPKPRIKAWATLERNGYYMNEVCLSEHTGTHVDSPAHFIPGGSTVDSISPEDLVGPGVMLDFTYKEPWDPIIWSDVEEALKTAGVGDPRGMYMVFSTGWRPGDDYPPLSPEAARRLAVLGVRGVAIDSPSPDRDPSAPAHLELLARGVVLVEMIQDPSRLPPSGFTLVVAPLKIKGGSGAPARVLALLD